MDYLLQGNFVMIDFFLLQNSIIEYTKDDFIAFLQSRGIKEPAIFTDESLDLDKYKADFSIFVDFDSYSIEELSSDSQNATLTMDLYLVRRNADPKSLKTGLLSATSAFYDWFFKKDGCNRSFAGLVDFGRIKEVDFYDAVSGSINIKIAQIVIEAQIEL